MIRLLIFLTLAFPLAAEAKIHRSNKARHDFVKVFACPSTGRHTLPCPGFVIDHRIPLCAGGADDPSNMQWQSVEEAKAKDKWERKQCLK